MNPTVADTSTTVKPNVVDPAYIRAHIATLDVSKGRVAKVLGITGTGLSHLLHGQRPLTSEMEQKVIDAADQVADQMDAAKEAAGS